MFSGVIIAYYRVRRVTKLNDQYNQFYSQYRTKTIHSVSDDKRLINYTQRQKFIFNQAESGNFTEDDHIVVLNIPLTVSGSLATLNTFSL